MCKARLTANGIAVILLSVYFILTITTALPWQNSGTADEIAHHIASGSVILSKGDFRIDNSHPPLSRYIIALPVKLFTSPDIPAQKQEWRRDDRSEFGRDFFYRYNHTPHRMLFAARSAIALIGLLCGILLFIWCRKLYHDKAALLGLTLYCFSPNIIAHSALATTDMAAAFFMLLSVASFCRFLKAPSFVNSLAAGLCLGLAQLSKFSLLLLYPLFLSLLALEFITGAEADHRKRLIVRSVPFLFFSIIVLWAGYGFEYKPLFEDTMKLEEKLNDAHKIALRINPRISQESLKQLDELLLHKPFPLSTHILGIAGLLKHGREGHGTFFLGKTSGFGNPGYFLSALLIKTPVPTLLFLLLGLWITVRKKIGREERVILLTTAAFFCFASFSKLQLGLRYILPLYPFFFIIASRASELWENRLFKVFSAGLIVWLISASCWIYPHYLSYFNELVGGPANGYKYLRDSNLDWGQDLAFLSRYVKNNAVSEVVLNYFGQADPETYGINTRKFSLEEHTMPLEKVYAISAQYIDQVQWARSIKPTALAGYSIFIYDLRKKTQPFSKGQNL